MMGCLPDPDAAPPLGWMWGQLLWFEIRDHSPPFFLISLAFSGLGQKVLEETARKVDGSPSEGLHM